MMTFGTQRRRRVVAWGLLAPALLLYAIMLVAPLINLLVQSLHVAAPEQAGGGISLAAYARFFGDAFFLTVMARTLRVAAIVAVLCLLFGWPLAYHLSAARGRARAYLTLVIMVPLLISVVVRSFGWVVILGPHGLVNNTLMVLGLTDEPLRLLFTEGAVIVGAVHMLLPLMVLPISAALDNIDPAVIRAARNLGAGPVRVFARVLLPLSLPGVLAGLTITFGLAASAFVTPAALGGARLKFMSSLIYQYNVIVLDWPFGGALSVILVATTVLILALTTCAFERGPFRAVFRRS